MNIQTTEKPLKGDGSTLELHSLFYTLQGEGPFTGRPAVFVRFAGCNLQCPWCDTDYTSTRNTVTAEKLVWMVEQEMGPAALVVITGGEPFRQNISLFSQLLIDKGYTVQVETNGTLPPPPNFPSEVAIVCSPKSGSVNPRIAERADCYKYVMEAGSVDPEDGLPVLALGHKAAPRVARPRKGSTVPIYIQPMDSYNAEDNAANIQVVLESCMKHGYTLQLQIHKLVGVE